MLGWGRGNGIASLHGATVLELVDFSFSSPPTCSTLQDSCYLGGGGGRGEFHCKYRRSSLPLWCSHPGVWIKRQESAPSRDRRSLEGKPPHSCRNSFSSKGKLASYSCLEPLGIPYLVWGPIRCIRFTNFLATRWFQYLSLPPLQGVAVLGIALIAMGEEIGAEMALRTFGHLVSMGLRGEGHIVARPDLGLAHVRTEMAKCGHAGPSSWSSRRHQPIKPCIADKDLP